VTVLGPYRALGFEFGLETDDPVLCRALERCHADLAAPTASARSVPVINAELRAEDDQGERRYHVALRWPDGRIDICEDLVVRSHVVDVIAWELNRRATEADGGVPVLHASVFAGTRGAVAVCGASHHGKSTMAAAAALAGYTYLSDDLAPIDLESLTVRPYPRPLMLRPGGREHLSGLPSMPADEEAFFPVDWYYGPREVAAHVATAPVPLVALVFTRWADESTLEPLTRAACLYGLLHASTNLAGQGAAGFRDLEALAERIPGYDAGCAEVAEVVAALADVIGAPS
jgi:hypothetical protein